MTELQMKIFSMYDRVSENSSWQKKKTGQQEQNYCQFDKTKKRLNNKK